MQPVSQTSSTYMGQAGVPMQQVQSQFYQQQQQQQQQHHHHQYFQQTMGSVGNLPPPVSPRWSNDQGGYPTPSESVLTQQQPPVPHHNIIQEAHPIQTHVQQQPTAHAPHFHVQPNTLHGQGSGPAIHSSQHISLSAPIQQKRQAVFDVIGPHQTMPPPMKPQQSNSAWGKNKSTSKSPNVNKHASSGQVSFQNHTTQVICLPPRYNADLLLLCGLAVHKKKQQFASLASVSSAKCQLGLVADSYTNDKTKLEEAICEIFKLQGLKYIPNYCFVSQFYVPNPIDQSQLLQQGFGMHIHQETSSAPRYLVIVVEGKILYLLRNIQPYRVDFGFIYRYFGNLSSLQVFRCSF
jgi:hypothetical protein